MRIFIFLKVLVFNQIFAAEIPENLKIYQNLTGITDEKVQELFVKGRKQINVRGSRPDVFPKFYYQMTNSIGGGTVSPIIWNRRIVNVESEMNNGIFLCMQGGLYKFSTAIGSEVGQIGISIDVNQRRKTYAR